MKYYSIPGTDLNVSAIIMGCMRIASLSEKELKNLISGYFDRGVNFFDHADIYGGGLCETVFGNAVDLKSSVRERMIIQGKCGIRKENGRSYYDFSKEHILASVDGILERLKTDYLDVLLLHRPDSLMEPEEVADAFGRLKESGKVRYFGLSNSNAMQIELLQKYCSEKLLFDQVQIGLGHSGIFDSGIAMNTDFSQGTDRTGNLLEYSRLKGITLQAWSPLQYGMFRGVLFDNPAYGELNKTLEAVADKYGTTKAAIAVAWILRHPAGIQVICGATKPAHTDDYCAAADIRLTRAEWYELYQAAGNPIP